MLYHCGLLDEQPENSRTLNWIKRPVWGRLPADVQRELDIFLAMPGFSVAYISHVFMKGVEYVNQHIGLKYEDLKNDVAANWLSASLEDCIKLVGLRPGTGNVPVLCQLRAVQQVKTGMGYTEVARMFGVTDTAVRGWALNGVKAHRPLPSGFALLTA